jgi:hypothetical protein
MNRKLSSAILSTLLLVFVQGCWAGDNKTPVQADSRPTKSDSRENYSYSESEIVVDKIPTSKAYWCGNDVIMYKVFTGKYDELSHPVYDETRWRNIKTKQGGKIDDRYWIYDCSPDGQWIIAAEKNKETQISDKRAVPVEQDQQESSMGSSTKLVNIVSHQEEVLPQGDLFNKSSYRKWSADGKMVFIRSRSESSRNVYKSNVNKSLEIYYLPNRYQYYMWTPGSSSIIASKNGGGDGLWVLSDRNSSFRKFIHKGPADFLNKLLSVDYGIFDSSGNWYRRRLGRMQSNSQQANILKCSLEDVLLECSSLLPDGVFKGPGYSVLPSGDAIHFMGYLNGEKSTLKPIRYSIATREMVDLSQYKEKFPTYMLIAGEFSPNGQWVVSYNEQRIAIASMANYYRLFGGAK